MIKGFNRRVVVMKNPDSHLFEEAYFIVKENAVCGKRDSGALDAARKIVSRMEEENAYGKVKKGKDKLKALLFLLLGIIVGILIRLL